MESSEFKFTDMKGCEWDLKITLLTAQRIDKADFSELTSIAFSFVNPEKDLFSEIFINTPFAMALVWVIIQDQVENNLIRYQAKRLLNEPFGEKRLEDKIKELQSDTDIDWELEFINRLDGDSLEAARQALLLALSDFFPLHRIVLLKFLHQIQKTKKMTDLEMENLMPLLEKQVESQVKEVFDDARKKLEGGELLQEVGGT